MFYSLKLENIKISMNIEGFVIRTPYRNVAAGHVQTGPSRMDRAVSEQARRVHYQGLSASICLISTRDRRTKLVRNFQFY